MKSFFLCLFVTCHAFGAAQRELASIKQHDRVEHARELLGKRYKKSAVRASEAHASLEQSVLKAVTKGLPAKYKRRSHDVAQAIIVEANKHQLDPFFVMAVIAGESSFNPDALGPVGEIGLMQLRPATGEWMAKRLKVSWKGEKTLKDPLSNIRLGTAYLAWLRGKFQGHGQLYLAAYNMGPKNVKDALSRKVRPKDYPRHVMKRYLAFYQDLKVAKL